jgi:transcription initiation factor TFIIH subunit 2
MPPPQPQHDAEFIDADSDSDISLRDEPSRAVKVGKGKGKAAEKRTRGKGKRTAKDTVREISIRRSSMRLSLECLCRSTRTHGRLTRVRGIRYRRTKRVVFRVRWKSCWLEVDVEGNLSSPSPHFFLPFQSLPFLNARLLAPASPIRRTIIRHLILLLDLSASMLDRDMRPTRFDLMLEYVREFVVEWFDQNPLGQIGVVGMRAGIGERISEMSGERERERENGIPSVLISRFQGTRKMCSSP